jgi:beta-lactamase superfamily II metal-dependent hydrolase
MAAAKKAASRAKPPVFKKAKRGVAKTAKTARKKATVGAPAPASPAPTLAGPGPAVLASGAKGLRVRMYRVGFGDFFLLTVRTHKGDRHILIDCGVHAQNLNSIADAVNQMAADCGKQLALVIMTHRHADHISGFATCSDAFSEFTVDRVWMPWFENPADDTAVKFQSSLTALAGRLSARLALSPDPDSKQLAFMADNITGGMAAAGGSSNQKALDVLHKGFKNTPAHDYYKAGDPPTLPQDLVDAGFSAQILGPPSDRSLISQLTNTNDQYLADAPQDDDTPAKTFAQAFKTDAYPDYAFKVFAADKVQALVNSVQPNVLAAQARAADNTLNNQSLVVLFSFAGKNLLFAGDAQWGNWENFLYGGAFGTPGHTEMTDKAKDILGKIDFYKVGHHGSRNATPKDAVAAMRLGCVGMCSTQLHAYNEVPRAPLLQALGARMQNQLARSDQVAVTGAAAEASAGPVPTDFRSSGELFIDYDF